MRISDWSSDVCSSDLATSGSVASRNQLGGTPTRRPATSVEVRAPVPASTSSANARSTAVRAIGPAWSSVHETVDAPSRGTSPTVGFSPPTPQYDDGTRIDTPVCVPSARGPRRDARATAGPADDPPTTYTQ